GGAGTPKAAVAGPVFRGRRARATVRHGDSIRPDGDAACACAQRQPPRRDVRGDRADSRYSGEAAGDAGLVVAGRRGGLRTTIGTSFFCGSPAVERPASICSCSLAVSSFTTSG